MPVALRRTSFALILLGLLAGCKIQPDPRGAEPAVTAPEQPSATAPAAPPEILPEALPTATAEALPVAPADGSLPLPELPATPAPAEPAVGPSCLVPIAPETLAWTNSERAQVSGAAVQRVRDWLHATHRAAVLAAAPENYAWLTGGATNQLAADAPDAVLCVLPERVLVVAPSDLISPARAPLAGLGILGRTYRWDLGRLPDAPVRAIRSLVGTGVIAADQHLPGSEYVADELTALRQELAPLQQSLLRAAGRRLADAVAQVLGAVRAAPSETALAGQLREAVTDSGLIVTDLRVTALDSLSRTGLTQPTETTLESGAAVSVTAACAGLQVTVGRCVTPTAQSSAAMAYDTARQSYAGVVGKLAAGVALREVYRTAELAATAAGVQGNFAVWSPGGAGAYQVAALPFGPSSTQRLTAGQAVTITVRVPGAYLADTILVQDFQLELLTSSPHWPSPTIYVHGQALPVPTLRGGELAVAEAEQSRATAAARRRGYGFLQQLVGAAATAAARQQPEAKPEPAAEGAAAEPAAEPAAGEPSEAMPEAAPQPVAEPEAEAAKP